MDSSESTVPAPDKNSESTVLAEGLKGYQQRIAALLEKTYGEGFHDGIVASTNFMLETLQKLQQTAKEQAEKARDGRNQGEQG